MARLISGEKITITQRHGPTETTQVITGFLTRVDHPLNEERYDFRPGDRISLGGPINHTMDLRVEVSSVTDVTDEQRKHDIERAKEQKQMNPDNMYIAETVRDPRTKMVTVYLQKQGEYIDRAGAARKVDDGEEPPIFAAYHEDVLEAISVAKPR